MNFLSLRPIGRLTITHQIILLVLAYLASIGYFYYRWATSGLLPGASVHWLVIFAPLYEEVLFRGVILGSLVQLYSKKTAILTSALLFGLWHLKNFADLTPTALLEQVLYTGLIIGPFLAWLTLRTKSIWPGVLVHTTNNVLLSPVSWWIASLFGVKALF